jgi:hypothetical protein
VSSITASQRYEDPYLTGIGSMLTNLIPYRKLNFLTPSYAPLIQFGSKHTESSKHSINSMTNFCFNRGNNLTKYDSADRSVYSYGRYQSIDYT